MSTIPRVTIGLPVYNGEDHLAEAIDSLLAQDYRDFELVISDNASTDATEAICRSYANIDYRVRYERHEQNRGAYWNFYRVLELARGEYFRWAADDDLCDASLLSRTVEVLDGDPGVVWCHSQTVEIDFAGRPFSNKPPVVFRPPSTKSDELELHHQFGELVLGTACAARAYGLIRTEVIRQTGRSASYYGWEKVMLAELTLRGRYHEIQEPLFFMRIHENASCNLFSTGEQQAFCDPQRRASALMSRIGFIPGYVRAVLRSPTTLRQRFCCLLWICRYLMQMSKWKRVVGSIARRTGAGGVHHEMLQTSRTGDGSV